MKYTHQQIQQWSKGISVKGGRHTSTDYNHILSCT